MSSNLKHDLQIATTELANTTFQIAFPEANYCYRINNINQFWQSLQPWIDQLAWLHPNRSVHRQVELIDNLNVLNEQGDLNSIQGLIRV